MNLIKHAFEIVAVLMLAVSANVTQDLVKKTLPRRGEDITRHREVLYLPKKEALESIHLGYKNVLADVLWFFTINYFGKHYSGDADYRWLSHFCDVITTLDPKAFHVYRFGAMMLAWEQGEIDEAITLLTKAHKYHSDNWLVTYMRGILYLYFKKDFVNARKDLLESAQLPDVHPLVRSLALKLSTKVDNDEGSLIALESLIGTTTDPILKKNLLERFQKVKEQQEDKRKRKEAFQ
jgi:tetratricopeptide (TPR) repeat protein